MSYSISSVDRDTLPAALLTTAKQHMVVTWADDDAIITEYLRWAISYFEQTSGWRVFGSTVAWLPIEGSQAASRYQCPVQPVSSFTVMSAAVDVSADYALEAGGEAVAPVWLVHSDGTAFPSDAAVSLVAGYVDPETIEPNALGNILRIAATLYEHRESVSTLSLEQIPFWANDLLSGTWIPRA